MNYSVAARSAVGRVRRNNEDNMIVDGEILPIDHMDSSVISKTMADSHPRLVGVFDGMGGYSDGEKASYIAASMAKERFESLGEHEMPRHVLHQLCLETNDEVCKEADGSSMGTTCALLAFSEESYTVCNLGDSPVFLIRDGEMVQISVDHNQKAMFESVTGKPAPPNRKFKLTQCIGIPKEEMIIEPFIASDRVQSGDFFLICSDGVTDMIASDEIRQIISDYKSPEAVVNKLTEKALEAGGRDNITAVCVLAYGTSNRVMVLDGFLKKFFG